MQPEIARFQRTLARVGPRASEYGRDRRDNLVAAARVAAGSGELDEQHMRYHKQHEHLSSPFGADAFGKAAETFARFFGTPTFLVAQTIVVALWIAGNALAIVSADPYPFILLNLAFSLQAAYAAPLILLAQTRQADRDKAMSDADARHREDLAQTNLRLLQQNTDLTAQVADLTKRIDTLTQKIHDRIAA